MSTTLTHPRTRVRVRVENGYAVRDLPNGDQVRVCVTPDPFPSEPERGRGMWNEGVSLVRMADGYNGIDLDEHEGLSRILDRVDHDGRYWWVERCDSENVESINRMWDADKTMGQNRERIEHDLHGEDAALEFVARYLRAFWNVQYAELHRHQGYSQGDWADIWVIAEGIEDGADPEAIARATWDEWSDWARGDCYIVKTETRTLAEAMDAGNDEDGWKTDGCTGSYYGESSTRDAMAEALGCDLADVPDLYELID